MSLEKLESVVSRLFFFGAFVLLVLALIERIASQFGYTILRVSRAATMLEMAVVLLVFVIAIQLRAIREAVKRNP
jgi:preprotein translocase subunit SecY